MGKMDHKTVKEFYVTELIEGLVSVIWSENHIVCMKYQNT